MTPLRQQFVQRGTQLGVHLLGQQFASRAPIVANRHRAPHRFEPVRSFGLADPEHPCQFGHRLMLKRVAQGLVLHSKLPRHVRHDRSLFRLQLHRASPACRSARRSNRCTSMPPQRRWLQARSIRMRVA